jgi:hypothetical protein
VFRRLEQSLHETGSVISTAVVDPGRPQTVRTPAKEDTIIATVERQTWKISHDIARELRLSKPWVLEVLHDDQLHPQLFLDDLPLSKQLREWLRHQHAYDDLFLHNVLCTDVTCFTPEGVINVPNSHL